MGNVCVYKLIRLRNMVGASQQFILQKGDFVLINFERCR